ncbi:MAG: ABC transporter permease [Clostridiales bacterium]|nr:ABC transporter permease [Clostridiales bacterium]
MVFLLQKTLIYAIPLLIVAIAGMFAERSGIINIALDGIMIFGSFIGAVYVYLIQKNDLLTGHPQIVFITAMLVAAAAGALFSLLLSFSAINLKADQTIGGTALNLLSTAIALVVVKRYNGTQSAKLSYDNSPFIFQVGPLTLNVFLIIGLVLLAVSIVLLYKTRFGLRLQACGEHPQAAGSVGINVYKMRWAGVLISGFLAGIGGFAYIVPAVQTWNFEVGVAGMGFLALAVMIFGQWKPGKIALAAIFFAIFKSLANIYDSIGWLSALHLTKELYNMMPFAASMIILAFTSKRSRAPKAEGIPYDKGQR